MDTSRVAVNEALARQFFAAQDRLRGGPDAALCAPGYSAELGGNPPMPREGHEGFAVAFYAGFPDMHHEIVEAFATASGVSTMGMSAMPSLLRHVCASPPKAP